MKRVLYIIGLMVLGLLIGYGAGWVIIHVMGSADSGESMDKMKLLYCIFVAFVALLITGFVNIVLHEAGHLVGGLLTGYKFLSFRIFNITLMKDADGWHWKKYDIGGTMGQCLMSPPCHTDVPYFWYNAGGVAVNLIIAIISATLLFSIDLSAIPFSICAMFLGTSIWFFLMNGIPMTPGGVPNDGKNILILWRHPEQRKHFHDMFAVAAEQSIGKRTCEMPDEWFESKPVAQGSTVMEISARSLHYARLMDEMRFTEAREIAEELMALGKSLPLLFQMEVAGDLLLLELVTLNRMDVVNELWNKSFGVGSMTLQKYIMTYRKYMPMKCAILYAYEFISHQSSEEAQQYYDEVKNKIHSYTQPGEARSALAIMERINASLNG